jgi:carbon storage regulator CsrA
VTVVEIRGHKVRLGFEAPHDVPVHREEVWVKLHAEEIAAERDPFLPEADSVNDADKIA